MVDVRERCRSAGTVAPPPGADAVVAREERSRLDEALARDRLTGALAAGRAEFVLVAAPPGFGKTTLLQQWREVDERPFAWVSLDTCDNDPVLLWTRIIAALRAADLTLSSAAQVALRAAHPDVFGAVVPLLAHDLRFVGHELVLVLDDYHLIHNQECHASMSLLLEWLPPNVTLVVSTRADPPLQVATLRARGDLLELRAVDLCFTAEEEAEFLNGRLGLHLGPATLATLHGRTEGWPAGVYLASLSLRKTADRAEFVAGFGGSNRHVVDYLTEVALDTLDERVRDFLLATSILEAVSAPLADAVTRKGGSADILDELERANLFLVALDDDRRWYRYHPLFAELLRAQLSRYHAESLRELHRRAADWYAGAGRMDDAIRHSVPAREIGQAVDLVLQRWSPKLRWTDARRTLRHLEWLPERTVSGDPRLLIAKAWAESMTGEVEEPVHALEAAAAMDVETGFPDGTPVEAAAAVAAACFPRGDAGGMRSAARRAREYATDLAPEWKPLLPLASGWADYLLGLWDSAQASLREAAESATERRQWAHVAVAKGLYALAALEAGDREVASAFAGGSREAVDEHGIADPFALGLADLATGALLAKTSPRKAEQALRRSVDRLRAQGEPLLVVEALIALAPVRRKLRGPQAGRECIAQARELLEGCADPGAMAERLEQAARTLTPAYRRADGETDLTERELEVLRYLAEGISKREIGAALFLSYNTIHSHTKSIYQKLGVSSRDAAITAAREHGAL